MAVEVVTHEYEWELGHRPRGYGWWAFSDGTYNPFKGSDDIFFAYTGLYSEAKREAVKYARAHGVTRLSVMS